LPAAPHLFSEEFWVAEKQQILPVSDTGKTPHVKVHFSCLRRQLSIVPDAAQ
jgi:hypothetical protein